MCKIQNPRAGIISVRNECMTRRRFHLERFDHSQWPGIVGESGPSLIDTNVSINMRLVSSEHPREDWCHYHFVLYCRWQKGQRRLKIESTVLRRKTTSVPMERLAHVRLISPMSLMKSFSKQNDKNVLTLDGAIWEAVMMDEPGSTCYKRLSIIGLFDLSMN